MMNVYVSMDSVINCWCGTPTVYHSQSQLKPNAKIEGLKDERTGAGKPDKLESKNKLLRL